MTISDEQVAHDLAIAYVTAKMSKQSNISPSSSDYTAYKSAFDSYKADINSVKIAIQNLQRMNESD